VKTVKRPAQDIARRKKTELEIERQALSKETDKASLERLDALNNELAELKEKSTEMKLHWQQEREIISSIQSIKGRIETVKAEEQNAERLGDLGKAAELRYGTIMNLQKELDEAVEILRTGLARRAEEF